MELGSSSPLPLPLVTYRECLKNHAACIGGHALDGCGEFMPIPSSSSTDPTSLKCAACGCHRNFHRRHSTPSPTQTQTQTQSQSQSQSQSPTPSPHSPPPVSHLPPNSFFTIPVMQMQSNRKRFRTKFTEEQKQKMYFFAEKVGWKMQRSDDKMIDEFCRDIGVRKPVFKVWMHNNKHSLSIKHKNTNTNARRSSHEDTKPPFNASSSSS